MSRAVNVAVGNCIGWWEQNGLGRQPMEPLMIQFSAGRILGAGEDIIGDFDLAGSMESSGAVRIVKQYRQKHHVVYVGNYDGEGLFYGKWIIDQTTGTWSIKLVGGKATVNEQEIEEIAPIDEI